ncbi:MAG: Uma2 family endonuclease [Tepidiformaceae bacterium]
MAIRKPQPSAFPAEELTVDDWFTMPDDGRQYELLEGVLVLVTPPSRLHQDIVGEIFLALKLLCRSSGGYAAIAPLGVALGTRIGFEPDVVYVAPGREEILTARGIEGVPDLVVEVLSRSTRAFDRSTKLRQYLEHGVREVWLVDPERRTITVHRPEGPPEAVNFGERVPSVLVDVGDAGLGAVED